MLVATQSSHPTSSPRMFENGASYINIFWSLHEQRADGENYGTHIGFERPAGKGSRRPGQSSPGLTLGTDHTSFWFSKHFWCVLPFIPGAPEENPAVDIWATLQFEHDKIRKREIGEEEWPNCSPIWEQVKLWQRTSQLTWSFLLHTSSLLPRYMNQNIFLHRILLTSILTVLSIRNTLKVVIKYSIVLTGMLSLKVLKRKPI